MPCLKPWREWKGGCVRGRWTGLVVDEAEWHKPLALEVRRDVDDRSARGLVLSGCQGWRSDGQGMRRTLHGGGFVQQ